MVLLLCIAVSLAGCVPIIWETIEGIERRTQPATCPSVTVHYRNGERVDK